MPFEWGENDCCSFVANAVDAMTGQNPMQSLAPYRSAIGALKLSRTEFGRAERKDPYQVMKWPTRLGFTEIVSVSLAQRGDIVAIEDHGRFLLGIVGGVTAAFPGNDGIVWKPANACLKAWKV